MLSFGKILIAVSTSSLSTILFSLTIKTRSSKIFFALCASCPSIYRMFPLALILRLSDFHFSDQVQLFNQAECVVGLHGAGFANLAFCEPGTNILELRSDTAGDLFKNFAINNELNYDSIDAKPKSLIFNNQLGDIEINIEILNKKIFNFN